MLCKPREITYLIYIFIVLPVFAIASTGDFGNIKIFKIKSGKPNSFLDGDTPMFIIITDFSKENLKNDLISYLNYRRNNDNTTEITRYPIANRTYFRINDWEHRRQERVKKRHAEYIQKIHKDRMKFVVDSIVNSYRPAMYLYNELQRIKDTRVVLDPLRKMIEFLERPGNEECKRKVLECYRTERPRSEIKGWMHFHTNHMVRHILKDPENDGVLN